MTDFDNPTDTAWGWAARHAREYAETGGQRGHEFRPGVFTLLLTTKGRRTGLARRTPLIYGTDGDRYVIVASKAGSPEHPTWYENLVANPTVRIQVRDQIMQATARTASGAERERLWQLMASIWPDYDNYRDRTEREIPVVVLEPV